MPCESPENSPGSGERPRCVANFAPGEELRRDRGHRASPERADEFERSGEETVNNNGSIAVNNG